MMTRESKSAALAAVALLSVQAMALYMLGQPPICTCGYIKLWEGVVRSAGTSQHLLDWYTFSHIIHGFLFYALARYLFPTWSMVQRFVFALGVEISWEIWENTPFVISLYRQQALAAGYVGDSIINSVVDSMAMIAGYVMAQRFSVKTIVILALMMELYVGYAIRDNLTLNVLNFVHRFEVIDAWQSAAP